MQTAPHDFRSATIPLPDHQRTPLFGAPSVSEVGSRVHKYFETSGFSRWTAIYGSGDIPPIWKVIRDGHQRAIEAVLSFTEGHVGHSALDAGCGTGNLSIELANRGYEVDAFDVSAPMIHFAKYINTGRTAGIPPNFMVGDIAALAGEKKTYDLVCCLDVLFHYPYEEVAQMLTQLANLSSHKNCRIVRITHAPSTIFWMRVGQRFHAKNRMTKLFMFSYDQVEQILYRAGYKMKRTKRIKFFLLRFFCFRGCPALKVAIARPAQVNAAPQLLKPRLYRTDFRLLNALNVESCRAEFRVLRADFEADWNRTLFKWTDAVNDLDYRPLWDEFYEFLNRSSIGEFSGCLLYSEVQKKISDPDVAAIYKCMARDEGRHSSFLSWVMRHMGRKFDLGLLPKVEKLQYMHPKLIFITTYLSEIVGFYRYQNISDHLKANPEFCFHPIFTYFDDWCNDERRHSRFFALMLRSQPQYLHGRRNHFAIKFFTLAVYITMYLRDCESKIYAKLGIDWEKYDVKVINETEAAARNVWGLAIRTDSAFFLSCLRKMMRNNFKNKAGRSKTGLAAIPAAFMRFVRYGNNIVQYAKLVLQPHDFIEPLPRSEWINIAANPADISGLRLAGAKPTSLRSQAEAVAG